MKALRAHHRGGPEVLVCEDAPVPTAGDDEVLVAVQAAAWTARRSSRRTNSHEFCGEVVAVGAGVTGPAEGEPVYGMVPFDRDGAAAEFVAVPATQVAAKPHTICAVEAAALPLPALTAQQALFDHANVAAGQRVLVLGGAGGVGGYAVQMAVTVGADVTATCRSSRSVPSSRKRSSVDYVQGSEQAGSSTRGPRQSMATSTTS